MQKSTPAEALATSPLLDGLSCRLSERMTELLAVVAAFRGGPRTPTAMFALEKKCWQSLVTPVGT